MTQSALLAEQQSGHQQLCNITNTLAHLNQIIIQLTTRLESPEPHFLHLFHYKTQGAAI